MKSIFITGTAGAGKSLLASKIAEYYGRGGVFAAILNADPGVDALPYICDVDVRDYVDIVSIMRQHKLGPNGALVVASDLVASKIGEIREEVERVNPDYLIVDTPGQVELFAYRESGPFLVQNLTQEERAGLFLFDGAMVSDPVNFVSIALLAASIRLRLEMPAVGVLTKTDLTGDATEKIIGWSESLAALKGAIAGSAGGETYSLASGVLRGIDFDGLIQGLFPVSSITGSGMAELYGAISRTINFGEDVEE